MRPYKVHARHKAKAECRERQKRRFAFGFVAYYEQETTLQFVS